jgi:glycosyltransferase involved in cell wall biosynthesis
MENKPQISIVVPLLNEEESLPELSQWIDKVMQENAYSYELLLIDDGSTDNSWNVIGQISLSNSHVKGIRFNRNYGKSAALHVGFREALGQVVITMDADLQDSPDEIPALYNMVTIDGYDLVSGWKKKRYDPLSKTIPTKLYNYVTGKMSGVKLHDMNCGLKAYKAQVVKNVELYGQMHRYIPVIAKWNGYKNIGEKPVQHQARKYGYTKFGLERFIFGPLDLLSIIFVTKYKKRPMHFFGSLGLISFLLGFLSASYLILQKLYDIYVVNMPITRDVTNNTWFYLALTALVIGVQLFMAGYLAEMMAINSSSKNDYIIVERI